MIIAVLSAIYVCNVNAETLTKSFKYKYDMNAIQVCFILLNSHNYSIFFIVNFLLKCTWNAKQTESTDESSNKPIDPW